MFNFLKRKSLPKRSPKITANTLAYSRDSGIFPQTLRTKDSIRDDIWLLSRLDYLWSNYFSDVPQINPVFIKFGKYSKFRLGSIKFDYRTKKSYITITSMFKDKGIPADVVDHTIAHELCHYTHGFSSPHPQLHQFPHSGGVIKRELEERKLGHLHKAYLKWVKVYRDLLREEYTLRRRG
jgi:hypothetical protein